LEEKMNDIRPSWDEIFMGFAEDISRRSSCSRLSVGCVVVTPDHTRVLAMGYNGNYRGGPNECDLKGAEGLCGCVHSEANALIKLDYGDTSEKIMYTTVAPCKSCAKLIVNAGIYEVVFGAEYRKADGLELLERAGVIVRQVHPCTCQVCLAKRNGQC
jgi:dCMP deaminase